jgi:hypothetical protein
MPATPDVDGFLAELTQLSRKYGVFVHACDCCNHIGMYGLPPGPVKDRNALETTANFAAGGVIWVGDGYRRDDPADDVL